MCVLLCGKQIGTYFLTRRHIPAVFRQSPFLLLSYISSLRIPWATRRFRFASADTHQAISIIVLVFSLLGIGAFCIVGTQVLQLLTTGIWTQGTIVGVERCGSKGQVSPRVQFADAKGRVQTSSLTGLCSSPEAYRVGQSLPITYVPDDPTLVMEQGSVSGNAMFALGALTCLLLVASWFLFASIKLMVPAQRQQRE
ncbi:MAG: DUF3592 domain-containing protein [Ktedonobacteraceae bacterium]